MRMKCVRRATACCINAENRGAEMFIERTTSIMCISNAFPPLTLKNYAMNVEKKKNLC